MDKTLKFIFLFLGGYLLAACSGDDNNGEDDGGSSGGKNGYALETAYGNSFQFYDSKSWLFSVAISKTGEIVPNLRQGLVPYGSKGFDYTKIKKNKAECILHIAFSTSTSIGSSYGYYSGDLELNYSSAKGGAYILYDFTTGKVLRSGCFTVNQKEAKTPPCNTNSVDDDDDGDDDGDDDDDGGEEPIPSNPNVTKDFMKMTLTDIYPLSIDLDYRFSKDMSSYIQTMGFCYDTKPNPTISTSRITTLDFRPIIYTYGTKRLYFVDDKPGTTFYLRAYAKPKDDGEIIYTDEISFQTVGEGADVYVNFVRDDVERQTYVDYELKKESVYILYEHYKNYNRYEETTFNRGSFTLGKGRVKLSYSLPDVAYSYVYFVDTFTGIKYYAK